MRYILLALFLITSAIYGQQVIKDLTVQDLKVVSTTKGSKPCPLMTQTQINAIGSPLNGQCVYNTTTNKLNVYNGSLWKAAGGGVDSWATATVYAVNDLVIESNKIYKCLIAHTSGTFATDLAASRWVEVSAGVSDHTQLTNIGTNTHAQIDSHISNTSNPHSVTKTQVGLSNVVNADTTTTANITDSLNKRFVTDAEKTIIGNTSGTNTGDQDLSGLVTLSTNQTITGLKQFNNSVGIGGAADANAVLDVQSTTKAFLPPRMTTAQMNAIASPVEGMTVYNTDFKAIASYDGTKWVYGFGFLNLDNTFSAQVSSTGIVSGENTDWINGNCSVASAVYTCTYTSGIFTVAPNCVALTLDANTLAGGVNSSSSTSAVITTRNSAASPTAANFVLYCQKQGVDYLRSSAQAYVVSNTNIVATSTEFTATGSTVSGTVTLENVDFINANCTAANPSVCTFNSGVFTQTPNCSVTSLNGGNTIAYITAISNTSISVTTYNTSAGSLLAGPFSMKCNKVGVDYSNSFNPLIVGSFQGYNYTEGENNVDSFSVSYGTTNTTTICSGTPCFIDQIGNRVSSVTRSGAGVYTLNTVRTYSKLKCVVTAGSNATQIVTYALSNINLQCSSCNSIEFRTSERGTGSAIDSVGNLLCQGSY